MPSPLEGILNAVNQGARAYTGGLDEADRHHQMMDQHLQLLHAIALQDAQERRAQGLYPGQQELQNAQLDNARYENAQASPDELNAFNQMMDRMRQPGDQSMRQPLNGGSHRELETIGRFSSRGMSQNPMAIEMQRELFQREQNGLNRGAKAGYEKTNALKSEYDKDKQTVNTLESLGDKFMGLDPDSKAAYQLQLSRAHIAADTSRKAWVNSLGGGSYDPEDSGSSSVLGRPQFDPDLDEDPNGGN